MPDFARVGMHDLIIQLSIHVAIIIPQVHNV